MTTDEQRAWLARTLLHGAVLAGLLFCAYLFVVAAPLKQSMGFDVVAYWRLDLAVLSVPALWPGAFAILAVCWPLRGRMHAAAPARQEVPVYHAADARQSRGEREPITA